MKKLKYIALGVILTLSVLFVFLNQTSISISFLFAEVNTQVSTAIVVAFFLGLFTGLLLMLVRKSSAKEKVVKVDLPADETQELEKGDTIHGIDLR